MTSGVIVFAEDRVFRVALWVLCVAGWSQCLRWVYLSGGLAGLPITLLGFLIGCTGCAWVSVFMFFKSVVLFLVSTSRFLTCSFVLSCFVSVCPVLSWVRFDSPVMFDVLGTSGMRRTHCLCDGISRYESGLVGHCNSHWGPKIRLKHKNLAQVKIRDYSKTITELAVLGNVSMWLGS